MNQFGILFLLIAAYMIPVLIIQARNQKKALGTIKCKRCHHVGEPKSLFVPFRGVEMVCSKCDGEEWEKND